MVAATKTYPRNELTADHRRRQARRRALRPLHDAQARENARRWRAARKGLMAARAAVEAWRAEQRRGITQ